MRWRKFLIQGFLLLLGFAFAAGNIWIAAARSTIPLGLNEKIAEKKIRREKHPGRDDVYLLHFNSGRTLHVDESVFESVHVGDSLSKEAWSKRLTHNQNVTELSWSSDFNGLIWVMPGALIVMLATAVYTLFRNPAAESPEP